MKLIVPAVYENGVFRPLEPLPAELEGRASVVVSLRKGVDLKALRKFRGCLSEEEAKEMDRVTRELRRVETDS